MIKKLTLFILMGNQNSAQLDQEESLQASPGSFENNEDEDQEQFEKEIGLSGKKTKDFQNKRQKAYFQMALNFSPQ